MQSNHHSIMLLAADFPVIRAYLPSSAHELITVCGIEAAFMLINQRGGGSVPLGKCKNSNGKRLFQQLADLIGEAAAQRITLAYGAHQRKLYIPACNAAKRYIRNQRIITRFDTLTATMTATQAALTLAREYGTTERHIWRILKG